MEFSSRYNNLPKRLYPSKLLLFGEYTVLMGSGALAIPFPTFSAQWGKTGTPQEDVRKILEAFLNYFDDLMESREMDPFLDPLAIKEDFESGIYLKSNIPSGAGLGSSGAFCAAIHDAYSKHPCNSPEELRLRFQLMEAFFHGKSSGLDPMVSYLNKSILLKADQIIFPKIRDSGENPNFTPAVFNSNILRNTANLVTYFSKVLKDTSYKKKLKSEYIPLVELLINHYLSGNWSAFLIKMKVLSTLQYELLDFLIPETVKPIWRAGLVEDQYYFKICGAGGGGFFLVFSKDLETVEKLNSIAISGSFFH